MIVQNINSQFLITAFFILGDRRGEARRGTGPGVRIWATGEGWGPRDGGEEGMGAAAGAGGEKKDCGEGG